MVQSLPPEICFLCLSRDRKIFCLSENFRHLFGFLTDWYPQADARVCWECRAMLEKLRRFKEQAKQAVCALERGRTDSQCRDFVCLSKVYRTQMVFTDLLIYDDSKTTSINDFSVEKSNSKISNEYKVEVELEEIKPKIEQHITKEIDLRVLTFYNTPDHIDEDDNDVGSKSFARVDLTEDNTENEIEHDTEQIILPQTKLPIFAASTSAEGEITSKTIEKSSVIKKARDNVKNEVKRKNPMVREIKRDLTGGKVLINKERRAEEQKYRLYQKGKAFECDCGKKFERRHQILQHMKVHRKKVMCEQCGYKCPNISLLKEHMLVHLDPSQRPHECQVCHNKFTTKYKLLVHMRRHTGERPFKCDTCEKAFVCKEALIRHMESKSVSKDPLMKQMCAQLRKKGSYTVARGARGKSRMVSRYDSNYKIIMNSENITYECNICKEIFAPINEFYKHYISAHKKDIPCSECNQTFKYPSLLANHVNIVHRGERPHLCNICGARFSTKQRLQGHMSTHSNEKQFKCDECSATFKYKCGLYTHKLIHKGDKPHQCDICEARFTLKGNLVGHMKVHTKDRPFECEICNKKFPWKRNLKNHFKTHLKEQE